MHLKPSIILAILCSFPMFLWAQQKGSYMEGTVDPTDADPEYIRRFSRVNEVRGFFRAQNSKLEFGSLREVSRLSNRGYFKNTTDQLGVGLTYKFINIDLSFALPNKRKLDSNYQEQKQFKFAFSYTGRKFGFRYYISQGRGLVVADPLKRFYSKPDVSLFKTGIQMVYVFNESKYSMRAALLQSEVQNKTAGSFLMKADLMYYNLKTPTGLVSEDKDLEAVYGSQVGLKYLRGPGLMLMPGYGMNFVFFDGQLYIAPIFFAGVGVAYNFYTSASGSHNKTNLLVGGSGQINFGYNHPAMYVNFGISQDRTHYSVNPSFLSETDFKFVITMGFRFKHLEKVIPESLTANIF